MLLPIAHSLARDIIVMYHYLHSMPGGSQLCFGVFLGSRLFGSLVLGCGPAHAYKLVNGATRDDCMTLTRLWLSDELPANSESRVIGAMIRALRKHTSVKFLVSYADPSAGHVGTIYQATNWLYTGLSGAMPYYDLGDGVARHSRSLSHAFGTHSLKHFKINGVDVKVVPQCGKHRYVYFIEPGWSNRLDVPLLPYPRKEG
jgi:hypothetical protein